MQGPEVAADVKALRQQVVRQQEQLRLMQLQLDLAVQAEHTRWRSTFEILVGEVRERWQHCQKVRLHLVWVLQCGEPHKLLDGSCLT